MEKKLCKITVEFPDDIVWSLEAENIELLQTVKADYDVMSSVDFIKGVFDNQLHVSGIKTMTVALKEKEAKSDAG